MADQPAQNAASGPVNPQDSASGPVQQPADNPSAQTGPSGPAASGPAATGPSQITLSDDQKAYLKSQGISEDNLTSPESVAKLINHAQSSQKTAAEIKTQLDKVKSTVVPEQQPQNPLVSDGQPQDGNPGSQPQGGIDPVTAFNLSATLATQFPGVKEDFTSGKFYQDMQAAGLPVTVNGQINLSGITNYAALRQKEIDLEAKAAELNKPGEIPDANPSVPAQPAADAPMTKQMALAILAQDPNHARAQEAKEFLQKSV